MHAVVSVLREAGCVVQSVQTTRARDANGSSIDVGSQPLCHITHPGEHVDHERNSSSLLTTASTTQDIHAMHLTTSQPETLDSLALRTGCPRRIGSSGTSSYTLTSSRPPSDGSVAHIPSSSSLEFHRMPSRGTTSEEVPSFTALEARSFGLEDQCMRDLTKYDAPRPGSRQEELIEYHSQPSQNSSLQSRLPRNRTLVNQIQEDDPISSVTQTRNNSRASIMSGISKPSDEWLRSPGERLMTKTFPRSIRPATAPSNYTRCIDVPQAPFLDKISKHSHVVPLADTYLQPENIPRRREMVSLNNADIDYDNSELMETSGNQGVEPASRPILRRINPISGPWNAAASQLSDSRNSQCKSQPLSNSVLDRSPLPMPRYGVSTGHNSGSYASDTCSGESKHAPYNRLHCDHSSASLTLDEPPDNSNNLKKSHPLNSMQTRSASSELHPEDLPSHHHRTDSWKTNSHILNGNERRQSHDVNAMDIDKEERRDLSLRGYASRPVAERRSKLDESLLRLLFNKDFHALCDDVEASSASLGFDR